jgi:mRNA interferase MazF
VVTVVPVTSNVARVYPFQTLLPADATGLAVDSKAQTEQVRSVAVKRIGSVLARVPALIMAQLDEALRLHLRSSVSLLMCLISDGRAVKSRQARAPTRVA